MIRKDELTKVAESKRLSLQNAEKDYLLDMVLFCIYPEFGNAIVLKGGTSLYKFYNLNRFSEDLDFTLNKRRFDEDRLTNKIVRAMRLIGIESRGTPEAHGNEINVRLHLKGPLYDGNRRSICHILLNISHRERIIRLAKREMLIPTYREIPSFEIFVMDESEIMAEKIRAIMTRNKPRDVYDLWFLLRRGVRPDAVMINKKFKICRLSFSVDRLLQCIMEKKPLWNTDLRGLIIGVLPEFDDVWDGIINYMQV